jgi:hypothetical protein
MRPHGGNRSWVTAPTPAPTAANETSTCAPDDPAPRSWNTSRGNTIVATPPITAARATARGQDDGVTSLSAGIPGVPSAGGRCGPDGMVRCAWSVPGVPTARITRVTKTPTRMMLPKDAFRLRRAPLDRAPTASALRPSAGPPQSSRQSRRPPQGSYEARCWPPGAILSRTVIVKARMDGGRTCHKHF